MRSTTLQVCALLALLAGAVSADIRLPTAEELAKSAGAFELSPGVVIDTTGGVVYVMRPEGGVESLSITSGELLWSSDSAAKPLALYGGLLLAQVDQVAAKGRLEVVLLDTRSGERARAFSLPLPPQAYGAVDDGLAASLTVRAAVRGGEPLVSWERVERYAKAVAPRPGEALESRVEAGHALDVLTGRTRPVDPGALAAPQRAVPAVVDAWSRAGSAERQVFGSGAVLAGTEVSGAGAQARIVLKRWDAASGLPLADVTLFSGPHILQFPSADERHLLVAERSDPGEFTEYEWTIFSLESGERVGQVSHQQSHARFFVSGDAMTYIERPYGRLVGDEWINKPLELETIVLGSAAPVWERPLRDTAFKGEFPP